MQRFDNATTRKLSGSPIHSVMRQRPTLSELFHENTKFTPTSAREFGRWIGYVGRSPLLKALMVRPHKVFSLMQTVPLAPAPPRGEFEATLAARRSVRAYSGESLSQEEIGRLLYFSYGETDATHHYRAAGSGGALYPLELYACAVRVDGLPEGVYHYDAEGHRLNVVRHAEVLTRLRSAAWLADIDADRVAAVFVITATFRRSTLKYRDRGYRMVLMEAGAVAQNLNLVATQLQLGACVLGGFQDDALSAILDIDGHEEAPLLLVAVGRPRR